MQTIVLNIESYCRSAIGLINVKKRVRFKSPGLLSLNDQDTLE